MKKIVITITMLLICGCAETTQIDETIYDPNAPELRFLAPTDPNWAVKYGDNERTRVILNVSANRGMSLQNRNILAELAKRVIALEEWLKTQHGLDELYIIDEAKE